MAPEARWAKLDNDHNIIECEALEAYAWAQRVTDWIVGKTVVGKAKVSTVFMMPGGRIFGEKPQWFETMIFGGPGDCYCERYATWDEAVAGHERACKLARGAGGEEPAAT